MRKGDSKRLIVCEMKLMSRMAGYTKWDRKIIKDILKELETKPAVDYIMPYQKSWRSLMNTCRINAGIFPKAILRYRSKWKRSVGCSVKRLVVMVGDQDLSRL
jgi:hypothetical protein